MQVRHTLDEQHEVLGRVFHERGQGDAPFRVHVDLHAANVRATVRIRVGVDAGRETPLRVERTVGDVGLLAVHVEHRDRDDSFLDRLAGVRPEHAPLDHLRALDLDTKPVDRLAHEQATGRQGELRLARDELEAVLGNESRAVASRQTGEPERSVLVEHHGRFGASGQLRDYGVTQHVVHAVELVRLAGLDAQDLRARNRPTFHHHATGEDPPQLQRDLLRFVALVARFEGKRPRKAIRAPRDRANRKVPRKAHVPRRIRDALHDLAHSVDERDTRVVDRAPVFGRDGLDDPQLNGRLDGSEDRGLARHTFAGRRSLRDGHEASCPPTRLVQLSCSRRLSLGDERFLSCPLPLQVRPQRCRSHDERQRRGDRQLGRGLPHQRAFPDPDRRRRHELRSVATRDPDQQRERLPLAARALGQPFAKERHPALQARAYGRGRNPESTRRLRGRLAVVVARENDRAVVGREVLNEPRELTLPLQLPQQVRIVDAAVRVRRCEVLVVGAALLGAPLRPQRVAQHASEPGTRVPARRRRRLDRGQQRVLRNVLGLGDVACQAKRERADPPHMRQELVQADRSCLTHSAHVHAARVSSVARKQEKRELADFGSEELEAAVQQLTVALDAQGRAVEIELAAAQREKGVSVRREDSVGLPRGAQRRLQSPARDASLNDDIVDAVLDHATKAARGLGAEEVAQCDDEPIGTPQVLVARRRQEPHAEIAEREHSGLQLAAEVRQRVAVISPRDDPVSFEVPQPVGEQVRADPGQAGKQVLVALGTRHQLPHE